MSPRLAKNAKDYNLAMDPALLSAGKIAAAAEDMQLAPLLRFLLRQHIEQHGPEEAKEIYATGKSVPHGTHIARFGEKKKVGWELPTVLLEQAANYAEWHGRSVTSVVRRALERYLQEVELPAEPEPEPEPEPETGAGAGVEPINRGIFR